MTNAAPPSPMLARRLQWTSALRALRRLLADPDDTRQVFEIMRSLNGAAAARGYRRLLRTREGGRIAYEREELAERFMDDAWLDALPAGSVGAAYRDFVRTERLSAEGLAEVSREGLAEIEAVHPHAWFGRRTRDVHDVWHVLSGYHRDPLGEACLVAFSFAQTGGLGWALIAVGAVFRAARAGAWRQARAIAQGWRRGHRAAWLLGEDNERLLHEPLDAARRRLRITPPDGYEAIPPDRRGAPG
jgi:ubiquinone biosynthesis protein COQ4